MNVLDTEFAEKMFPCCDFRFLTQDLPMQFGLALNLLCGPGWPRNLGELQTHSNPHVLASQGLESPAHPRLALGFCFEKVRVTGRGLLTSGTVALRCTCV